MQIICFWTNIKQGHLSFASITEHVFVQQKHVLNPNVGRILFDNIATLNMDTFCVKQVR